MKHILLFCVLWYSIALFGQGYATRDLPAKQSSLPIERYDSTTMYLALEKLSKNLHYYDGQRIFFLKPHFRSEPRYAHLTGFYVSDSIAYPELADTVWLKRRKKVRPEDFVVNIPKSNSYKATYCSDQQILRFERIANPYSMRLLHDWSGFFTPADMVEGKEFTIRSVEFVRDDSYGKFVFHLTDSEGQQLLMHLYNINPTKPIFVPILMCACYERYVARIGITYVANTFFDRMPVLMRTLDRNYKKVTDDITVSATSFVAGGQSVYLSHDHSSLSYHTPMLFFKDRSDDELMMRIDYMETPSYFMRDVDAEKVIDGGTAQSRYYSVLFSELISAEQHYAELERKRQQEEAEKLAKEEARKEREERIRKRYGVTTARLILEGRVRIGMTAQMCRDAWGEPSEINRSSGSWGVHEQWVYGVGSYLYFEDGILTSIQN